MSADAELESLVACYLDGRLGPEEAQALRVRLRADPAARSTFVAMLDIHALLTGDAALKGRFLGEQQTSQPPRLAEAPARPRWRVARRPWSWLGAAAAVVLLAGAGLAWLNREQPPRIVRAVGDRFEGRAPARDGIEGRELRLAAGLLELRFPRSEATVVIEAPAVFRVLDDRTLWVGAGRVAAHVRDGRRGLRLVTPHTEVLDLGTRFAVDVIDGRRSEVHVFEGKVATHHSPNLAAPARQGSDGLLLRASEAVRIGSSGAAEASHLRTASFVQPEEMGGLETGWRAGQAARWRGWANAVRRDPTLLAWIGFERQADGTAGGHGGAVFGARWVQGRFADKGALEFVDQDDHVRLDLASVLPRLTMMTWVRLDRVPEGISSLLHTDDWDTPGQVHWMIPNQGQMRLALYSLPRIDWPKQSRYWPESGPVVGLLGRWMHLAVVYDSVAQRARFFTNGRPDTEIALPLSLPAVLRRAQLGNWNLKNAHSTQHRRLSGRMDEFVILGRALSAQEVRASFEAGNPYQ